MKKFLSVICIMVFVVSFWGCNDGSFNPNEDVKWTTAPEDNRLLSTEAVENTSSVTAETEEDTFEYYSDIRYAERYMWASLSEYGVFNDTYGDYVLDIMVKDVGEEVIFCDNPGCKHPNVPVSAGTPDCMATLYENSGRIAYYNGTIYFFRSNGIYEHRIYTMNIANGERMCLAKLPFGGQKVGQFTIFKEDKMYYTARLVYEDEITGEMIEKHRIMELSLRDGSYRFLTEETEDLFTEAHLTCDKLWVRRADQSDDGRLYVEIIDINTLETTLAIDKHEWELGNRYIDVYDEDSYYYWDKITYKIGIRNINGTVEKVLL